MFSAETKTGFAFDAKPSCSLTQGFGAGQFIDWSPTQGSELSLIGSSFKIVTVFKPRLLARYA